MSEENKTPKGKKVRVRVSGTQPLHENGNVYQPAHTKKVNGDNVKVPAEEFETTPDRAAALGDAVEVIG